MSDRSLVSRWPRCAALATVAALLAPPRLAAAATPCADCHDPIVAAFGSNAHARAARGAQASCETCHAGAAAHAESGDAAQVLSFRRIAVEQASEACLRCHSGDRSQALWRGSAHDQHELSCVSCHAIHGGHARLLARADEGATCFTCHSDVRADLLKRSTHPLAAASRFGAGAQMTCSSCHNPHGAASRALIAARSVNDKCYECHAEKRAPVLWEHSPVKEDCLTCHAPHGSSTDKLLVQKIPRLCQECHLQGRHQSGTLAPTSTFAFNRSCLNCHPQVHGSNSPSGAVLQR